MSHNQAVEFHAVPIHAVFHLEMEPIAMRGTPWRTPCPELVPWLVAVQEREEIVALKAHRMRPRHSGAQSDR